MRFIKMIIDENAFWKYTGYVFQYKTLYFKK